MWTVPAGIGVGTAVVAAVAAVLALDRWRWPAVFLLAVAAASWVAGRAFLAPVAGVEHRRYVGFGEGGLVLKPDGGTATGVAWDELGTFARLPGRGPHRYALVIRDGDKKSRIVFRDIHDGASLVRSVLERRPVPAPVRRRALVGTAVAVVVALLGWYAFAAALGVNQVDGVPADLDGYAAACVEPGTAFRGAAAFADAVPRPAVVIEARGGSFENGSHRVPVGSGAWQPASAAEVQLVVCVRRADSRESTRSCEYDDASVASRWRFVDMDIGEYQVTVYEARTRRTVRERVLLGDGDECPTVVRSDIDTLYTGVEPSQYRESMSDLVTG